MNMNLDLLACKKVWKFSPAFQVIAIAILFVTTILMGYIEYQKTGLLQGYPLSISIIFVPIYEEIIFRGIILGTLIKNTSKIKAIIISSLLFGLWHLKNIFFLEPEQLIHQIGYTTLFFGPIMAYITLRAKTIWPAVILHYLNNLIVASALL